MGFGYQIFYSFSFIILLLHLSFVHATHMKCFNETTSRGKRVTRRCDIFEGSWVFDETYPIYAPASCPYIRKEFNCQKYGRPDSDYLKYRWQPKNCNIPRFNGKHFLKRFKGKKIMFVGDSLSLNFWNSLICLLQTAVPHSNITLDNKDPITAANFHDYGVSVILYNSHFLVDVEQENVGQVMKLDSIKGGEVWKDMDVLIFYTFRWWYRDGIFDYIQDGYKTLKDMDRTVAFEKGLKTWAKWVNSDVNPAKTKVFFQWFFPSRPVFGGARAGAEKPGDRKLEEKTCASETRPLVGLNFSSDSAPETKILKKVLRKIKVPVKLLNLTTLSQLRIDAHPGNYNGVNRKDCTHWCIPGLPDNWNQLFYTSLIR